MARILPGSILHLNAARAASGTGAGSNTVPTSEWYDLSGNGNHGALTGFDYEPGNRPRTNVETDKALWHDLSGNGNDGTLTGFSAWDGVTDGWTDDPALKLAGDDDCIDCGVLGVGEDALFACDVWFTTISTGIAMVLASEGNTGSTTPFWDLFMTTSGRLQFNVRNDAAVISEATHPGIVNDGALHHAFAVRAADGKLYIYLDESNVGGYNPSAPALPVTLNTTNVGVLHRHTIISGYFNGCIRTVRMYKGYAPSPAEVAQNYAAGLTGTGYVRDGLVLDLNAARAVRPSGWVEL